MTDLFAHVSDRLTALSEALLPGGSSLLGLAVSGGSDSLALMHLAARTFPTSRLRVASVDHGLRAEAADEVALVARQAAALGLSHTVLTWQGWDKRGNLQDNARRARRTLFSDWAQAEGIKAIALGHTRDDQAETVLMRLARGSGVDGLAGMSEVHRDAADGPAWLRPLLSVRRDALRDWLRSQDIPWSDDPSNDDPLYDRVRARQFLSADNTLGLSVDGLADTAERMHAARTVLNAQAATAFASHGRTNHGAVFFNAGLWEEADDTVWRLLAAALCLVAQHHYRPRLKSLRRAADDVRSGRTASLHGCLMVPDHDGFRIQAEPNSLMQMRRPIDQRWGHWQITGASDPGLDISMVGEQGLQNTPNWRDAGLPHLLAQTTPGIWRGPDFVAAPALESCKWQAKLTWSNEDFIATLLSH